jgi:hypothetical protein
MGLPSERPSLGAAGLLRGPHPYGCVLPLQARVCRPGSVICFAAPLRFLIQVNVAIGRCAEMAASEDAQDVFFRGFYQKVPVAEMRWEWPI